jgi:hypothetical protein
MRAAPLFAIVAAMTAFAGCSPRTSAPPRESAAMSNGKTVTLEGKAENAKAGAVVVSADGSSAYVDGLENGWPADVSRKRVRVTGVLREEKRIPDPGTNPVTAGAFGTQTILFDATWTVIE